MTQTLNLSAITGAAPQVEDLHSSTFHALLYRVFLKPREPSLGGVVVAISSCNRGEGVTFITRALLHELGRSQFNSVAGVNMSFLRRLHEPTLEAIRSSLKGLEHEARPEGHKLSAHRRSPLADNHGPWEGSWQYRRDCIDLLRSEFDYSIVDCPALSVSGDLLSIAPFVDGVILVIEANRTRRDEPRQAEQCIAASGGNVLGFVLNKRTREMPLWLDRAL